MQNLKKYVYSNNKGQEFVILSKKGNRCLVMFTETNYVRYALFHNLARGKITDHFSISRYGVGYTGMEDRTVPYHSQAKQLWANMLKRCYTDDPKGYRWKGTKVDRRWHCFATFLNDLPNIPGFSNWLVGGQNLDKDTIVKDCNVYSLDTCAFIPEGINKAQGAYSRVAGVRAKYEKIMNMKGKD